MHPHSTTRRKQRGAAILMAILTVALVATLVAAITAETGAAIEQLSGRNDQAQARWLARGAIEWARNVLQFDYIRTGQLDSFKEEWAITVPPLVIDEGKVGGEIVDQSGRFNINTLVTKGVADPAQRTVFLGLLTNLGVPPQEATQLTDAITDWIDADSMPSQYGAERQWYGLNQRPTLPPDAPLIAVNELLAVRGMTSELLDRLRPHIAALPADATKLNVNTASPELLSAFTGLPLATASQFYVGRTAAPYKSVAEFIDRLPKGTTPYNSARLDVQSQYFMAVGRAQWGETTTHMQVLLRRNLPRPDIIHETIL